MQYVEKDPGSAKLGGGRQDQVLARTVASLQVIRKFTLTPLDE